MADISYTPTFHHPPWKDRVDRVEAAGPNGFNVRFEAIEGDLKQVSTVVAAIGSDLDGLRGRQHRLAFTPTLQQDPSDALFSIDANGAPTVLLTDRSSGVSGIQNVGLPHGARLSGLRIRGLYAGSFDPGAQVSFFVALRRVPRVPSIPPSDPEDLISANTNDAPKIGPFDLSQPADDPSKILVDLDHYRYVVGIGVGLVGTGALTVTLQTLELTYAL